MKYSIDAMLDAAFDYIKNNCDSMRVCTSDVDTAGVPDYSKITGASALTGSIAMDSSDFTHANGDTSGRKTTVAAQSDVPVTASGTAAHVVLLKTSTSTVLYVTSCTTQALTNGSQVSVPAWDIELRDPS